MADPAPPEPHDLVALLRSGEAPLELRKFAARVLLPLERDDQLRALFAVAEDEEPEVAGAAKEALQTITPEELSGFLLSGRPTAGELDAIAHSSEDPLVLEEVIRHPEVSDETLGRLAREVTGGPQEAFVINQVRLLRTPALIDALFQNPALTADARRRLNEIVEEFFDKEQRRQAADLSREEEERLAGEIAEAEALEKEVKARDHAAHAALLGIDLETSVTTGAAYKRIAVMTVSEKIKLAYSGGKEERRILMADANKLIGAAVLKSRGLTVNEVEHFCAMRHLDEDIFRKIAQNREWLRKPAIILALVKNPKVNLAITLPLIKRLHERDLKHVMRDNNLPEGLRISARKIVQERRK
ncbi:MAG: hypothetical protein ABI592_08730 [Acidobacteriota bacterium]